MATSSRSCEVRVDTLEKTVKARQLENQALKSQINSVNTIYDNALFMHDYCSYRLPSTFNNFFKSIDKVH